MMFNNRFYFLFKKCKNKTDFSKYDFIEVDHIDKNAFYGKDNDFKGFLKQRIEEEKRVDNHCNYIWLNYIKAKKLDLLW